MSTLVTDRYASPAWLATPGVSDGREYPSDPRVGVGAVVLDGARVLLVRRGKAPSYGKWSLPGGMVELGETTREAVQREIEEECGLKIRVVDVAASSIAWCAMPRAAFVIIGCWWTTWRSPNRARCARPVTPTRRPGWRSTRWRDSTRPMDCWT